MLAGGAQTLDRCVGLQLELSFVPLYSGGMLVDEAISFAYDHGFRMVALAQGFTPPDRRDAPGRRRVLPRAGRYSLSSRATSARSESTISRASSSAWVWASQPSSAFALLASPLSASTSDGRSKLSLCFT